MIFLSSCNSLTDVVPGFVGLTSEGPANCDVGTPAKHGASDAQHAKQTFLPNIAMLPRTGNMTKVSEFFVET